MSEALDDGTAAISDDRIIGWVSGEWGVTADDDLALAAALHRTSGVVFEAATGVFFVPDHIAGGSTAAVRVWLSRLT